MGANSLVHTQQQYNEPQNKSKCSQNQTRCKDVGSRVDTCKDKIVMVCKSGPVRGDLYCGAGSWHNDSSFEMSFLLCFKNAK